MSPDLAIGPYRVGAAIGTGGFASVFRAYDDRLGADVAVKLLADNHSLDPEVRARFVSEGHVLRRIDSPYVIRVFDVGETDRLQPFLVLEHADRGDLEARLEALRADGYRPTPEATAAVASVLGKALEAIHAEHVVHRDVKPRNLLIRSTSAGEYRDAAPVIGTDERLMLADLGFAKDLAASSGLTVAGGTSGFSAPEQGAGGVVDARADLYAASAVLVWFVTGSPPDAAGVWKDAVQTPGLESLVGVLEDGLADDPEHRPPDATEWLARVTGALAPAFASPAAAAVPLPNRRRRWPAVAASVVAAAVLLGAMWGAFVAWSDQTDRTDLGDGRVRVEATGPGGVVAIVGPAEVEVGTTARFTTDPADYATWLWVGPDGRNHLGVGAIDVTTTGAGTATVRLTATFGDGTTTAIEHEFLVVAEGS